MALTAWSTQLELVGDDYRSFSIVNIPLSVVSRIRLGPLTRSKESIAICSQLEPSISASPEVSS